MTQEEPPVEINGEDHPLLHNPPRAPLVERGIPLPKRIKPCKYPWAEMKVGDSFLIDAPLSRMVNATRSWGMRHKWKFALRERKLEQHGEQGIRIWRTK